MGSWVQYVENITKQKYDDPSFARVILQFATVFSRNA